MGQFSFEVEFAGEAPGLVAGVMQINFGFRIRRRREILCASASESAEFTLAKARSRLRDDGGGISDDGSAGMKQRDTYAPYAKRIARDGEPGT